MTKPEVRPRETKISAGVSGQGVFRSLHLLSTKTLTDLPEILFYKCLYLAPSWYKLWFFSISECKDTSNCVFTQAKKTFTKLYNMVKQTNYNFTKRFLGFMQNNRDLFHSTSNQSGFKKPVSCWMMGVRKHPHHKLANFSKRRSLRRSFSGLCKLTFVNLGTLIP